ncbi:aquaporin family protein [Lactobacillus delbrueckii subsp. lactis]|uniref:Aquaporin family protein n=2 Tax=Lactobacillus delbrueckii TaxID=1584 RepID=A0ABD4W4A7_9LACO|nr:D/L-lactic acid transporter LarD [Lactobacillus delbrueckii]ADQ60103.1 Glycerol uptake facilitator permease (Major Intrinsic Protein Family) [Lactobacillus delbrueckii subsp. bulgaricus ND02]MBN6090673.1 aquaporin family protein [Lactobacillus delbrueckii subsp. bulgaricus]MBO3082890.1 aquaporin family protein [Lactobacillus delbrueckii subsp. bulgaricus]MCD5439089.1 aquaporin family protein [Lactobacillus delbrueckii subsp. lactis]MCD5469057.1 aquaporin family protein [Lactobacillus delbru
MIHNLLNEFLSTGLMILFGVGVHCDDVLNKTKYHGSGHIFAITTWSFGITACLFIFGGVSMNPAMALSQAILGIIPWSSFIPYTLAEFAGAFAGALLAYFMYADHFKASEDTIDGVATRNIFSTNPNLRNLPRNWMVEMIATTIFLTGILAIVANYEKFGFTPLLVGLLVWAIGMGLGGTTGFAMNQARDLGPRLAYQILPIKNKANNDWQYGLIVPGTAPFVGAVLAAMFVKYFLKLTF